MKTFERIGILGVLAVAFSAPLAAQHDGGHHSGRSHHGSSVHHGGRSHHGSSVHHGGKRHHSGRRHHGVHHGSSRHGWGSSYHGYQRSHHGYNARHHRHYGYPFYGSYGYGYGYPSFSGGFGYGCGNLAYGYGLYPRYGYGWDGVYGGAGYLDCDVQPEDARVLVDGEEVGVADDFDGYPAYLDLEPGRHRIEFRAGGYEPMVREVVVRPGRIIQVDDELQSVARGSRQPRARRGEPVEQEEPGDYDDDERPYDRGPRR